MINQQKEAKSKKIDIIWNLTRICNWSCVICCVDAIQINNKKDVLKLISYDSKVNLQVGSGDKKSIFEEALEVLQRRGQELTLSNKLKALDNMEMFTPKIDFSGGDPLLIADTLKVMKKASKMFGKENITLTATGIVNPQSFLENFAPLVGEFNFTFDNVFGHQYELRPSQYTDLNLKLSKKLVQKGVKVRAECPLTRKNINEHNIKGIYFSLHKAGIPLLLLMRLFPVGRGGNLLDDIPTEYEYRRAIKMFREEEKKFGYPKVKLQCALKYLDDVEFDKNPCDMGVESFGLMPNGDLIVSPWGYGTNGTVLDKNLFLGNLVSNTLMEILQSSEAQYFAQNANLNFGHCKIHAAFNSRLENKLEKYFDETDPLYVRNEQEKNQLSSQQKKFKMEGYTRF